MAEKIESKLKNIGSIVVKVSVIGDDRSRIVAYHVELNVKAKLSTTERAPDAYRDSLLGLGMDKKTVVTGIEMFRKELDSAIAGDNAGVLMRGVNKDEIQRGMVLAKPNTITPHKIFEGEVYILSKDEGGRHTPFFNGYRPQFYFRTTDVTGIATLPEGTEMVMPGDHVKLKIEMISEIAMDVGLRFAIREGGRTVGSGVVTKIFE